MGVWDVLTINEFTELHLDSNRLSVEQKEMTKKHNHLVELACLVRNWVDNAPTTCNSEYRGFKNHFVGKTSQQWNGVEQLGKDLEVLEKPDMLLEIQSKYEIGLNLLHLIKATLEELGQISVFITNRKRVRKKLDKAYNCSAGLANAISGCLRGRSMDMQGAQTFFDQTGVLINSLSWSYLKSILDLGEHNQRKVIDAFF